MAQSDDQLANEDFHRAGAADEPVEDAINRVVDSPSRWRVIEEDVRRCLTRIFPYAVLYTIETDFLLIVAVMHCSREPRYWRERMDSR